MGAGEASLLKAVSDIWLAFVVGYVLFKVLTVSRVATNAIEFARKWLAWSVIVVTVTTLPAFFRQHELDAFVRWLIVVVFYGAVAFVAGWFYGKFSAAKGTAVVGTAPFANNAQQKGAPMIDHQATRPVISTGVKAETATNPQMQSDCETSNSMSCPRCGGPASNRQCWSCQAKW